MKILIITGNLPLSHLKSIIPEKYSEFDNVILPEIEKSELMLLEEFPYFEYKKDISNYEYLIFTYSSTVIKLFYDLVTYLKLSINDKNLYDKKNPYFYKFKNLNTSKISFEIIDVLAKDLKYDISDMFSEDHIRPKSADDGITNLSELEDLFFRVEHKLGEFMEA